MSDSGQSRLSDLEAFRRLDRALVYLLYEVYSTPPRPESPPGPTPEEELQALERLALDGDVEAQDTLGRRYCWGFYSIPSDAEKAVFWLEMADRNGHPDSWETLVRLYCDESDGLEDWGKAEFWLERMAQQDAPYALYLLGLELLSGEHLKQDLPRALSLLSRACLLGESSACKAVGGIYQLGKGVEVDWITARHWYRLGGASSSVEVKAMDALRDLQVLLLTGDSATEPLLNGLQDAFSKQGLNAPLVTVADFLGQTATQGFSPGSVVFQVVISPSLESLPALVEVWERWVCTPGVLMVVVLITQHAVAVPQVGGRNSGVLFLHIHLVEPHLVLAPLEDGLFKWSLDFEEVLLGLALHMQRHRGVTTRLFQSGVTQYEWVRSP
jgi:hypothetical protein